MSIEFPFGTNIFEEKGGSDKTTTTRPLGDTQSFARVVIFHYVKQTFDLANYDPIGVSESDAYQTQISILEEELTSVDVNKDMNAISGNFQFEVLPTKNWKRAVAPGDWCLIYLYNKPAPKFTKDDIPNANIVMVGNVDRISRSRRKNENIGKRKYWIWD